MKEPLIEVTVEDQQPAHPPARPRHASLSTGNPSYNHARHISLLMKPLPLETASTIINNQKLPPTSAPPENAAPLSSIAYQIWPVPTVSYKNISGRLSRPFGFSSYHDLETNSKASSQEKILSVHITDESSLEEGSQLGQDEQEVEWIPQMLQPRYSYALSAGFVVLFALLQLFDILDRTRGGFAVRSGFRSLANYIPTTLVVLLGFFWDMVLKNLKEVGPWALMAKGWTRAEDGLYLVNYIDALDVKGFLLSVKMRQFGISLGYVGAVLCGALVPFANTLFFTDPIPRITTTTQPLVRTSQLLVNDTLTGNGGRPTRNSPSFDPQSFITYMAIQRENFAFPDWTIQQHAFDSFNLTAPGNPPKFATSSDVNITLAATISAFSINSTCDPISWVFDNVASVPGSSITQTRLVPDANDLQNADCIIHPENYPQISLDTRNVTAWFNYTTCGEEHCSSSSTTNLPTDPKNCGDKESDDLRLTMSVWNPDIFDGDLFTLSNSSATIPGLLCKIGMFTEEYAVRADAREARLVSVGSFPVSSRKLAIKNPESIILKVNQYLKQRSAASNALADDNDYGFPLEVFLDDPLSEAAYCNPSEYFDNGEMGYYPGAVRPSFDSTSALGVDRFILMMSKGNNLRIANYAKDMAQMQGDMSDLLQELVSQIVNTEYRRADAVQIEGSLVVSATVIRMRQVSLRVLQVMLILLSVITVFTSTKLRPRTHLRTDPRSLGAMATLLSRSDMMEKLLQDTGRLSERSFLTQLKGQYMRTTFKEGRTILELQDSQRYSKMLQSLNRHRNLTLRPWCHTSLRLPYRTALVGTIALIILILGISWWRNDKSSGIAPTSTQGNHALIYFIPMLLVLLSYVVHTFDTAIQCLQPYIQLSCKPLLAKAGLTFNPIRYSAFTIDYRSLRQSGDRLVLFSSVLHLLIPSMKIAAAGLFITALRPSFMSTLIPLESSLVNNLDTYNLTNFRSSDAQEEILRARALTLIQSAPGKVMGSGPIGLLDGLVFSNVTNRMSNEDIDMILDTGAEMQIRIPAIQVTPVCKTFGTTNYRNITPVVDIEGNPTINIVCDIGTGLEKCPSQTVDKMFNSSSSTTSDIAYFWNRDSLLGSPTSNYAPESPEFDGVDILQNVTTFLLAKANQPDSSAPGFEITDVASFWCNMNYIAVAINVIVSRPRQAVLGTQQTLPLAVKSYDVTSITPILEQGAYNLSHLNWTNINRLSTLHSIYPLEGRNILYSIMKMGNPNVTDDEFVESPKLLAQAGSKVLRHFAAIMIDLARPFVEPMNAAQSKAAIVDAQVVNTRPRLIQSKSVTIVVQVFLGALLVCILVVGFRLNTRVSLMKAPNSIGSQIGLMTGSELVRLVREEDNRRKNFGEFIVGQSSEDALWAAWEGFLVNLGWWERSQVRSPNLARSEIEVDTWIRGGEVDRGERRFGIDVGEAEKKP